MCKLKHSANNLVKKYENNLKEEDVIKKTLLKKANGFVLEEISEEYAKEEDGGTLKLTKRKVTTKEVPPDISAIKVLLELNNFDFNKYKTMTDEELINEKNRLIKLLEGVSEDDRS